MSDFQEEESFRDSIATITKDGKRAWIFPKKPKGKLYEKRKIVSYVLLLLLISFPFIKVNEHQFMLFNFFERRFNIFSVPFWPQDFYLFALSMVIGVVFVTLFTVAFGRIFCGWICPQTIFLEMVFRRIEYLIDGDRGAQIKLKNQEWNAEKIRKRLLKWSVFFIISFIIANVFLAYLIGGDTVLELISSSPSENIETFIALIIFTCVFYFVFTWFREQVCIIACPYGRLQGVLLDNKSIVVSYDHVRGEGENGRAKFKKNEDRKAFGKGDCIDCKQCINVCPTGIDIRNGTQLECVNCTACIDECNHVMEKVGLPKDLIRYASEDEITKNKKFKFTNRMKGYTAVLTILIGVFVGMLFLRSELQVTIQRLPGQLYQIKDDKISNVYTFRILNKSINDYDDLKFRLTNYKGDIVLVGNPKVQVKAEQTTTGTLFIEINSALINQDKVKLKIEVYQDKEIISKTTTNFLGPIRF